MIGKRVWAWAARLDPGYTTQGDIEGDYRIVGLPEQDANLVTSLVKVNIHMPVLDLDVPHRLVPSATPGHSHLYIDVPIPWHKYHMLLVMLADCGILEQGYVNASIERGYTCVRKPGVTKEPEDLTAHLCAHGNKAQQCLECHSPRA